MDTQNKASATPAIGREDDIKLINNNEITISASEETFPIFVAEWPRNAREVVRVALDHYNGRHTVNARIWYHSDDGLKPGKSGITLSVKHLPALAEARAIAARRAREMGLIDGGEQ